MNSARAAARGDASHNNAYASTSIIPSPPQAYASNSTTTGNRYQATYAQQTPTSPFESLDRRPDMGQMYVPLQPDQYGPYSNSGPPTGPSSARQVAAPAQALPPSFYGASVVPSGQQPAVQQRNPFSQQDGSMQPIVTTKEQRRKSQMDPWQQ